MGRHKKTVLNAEGLDRRGTGYYATPGFVADFLASYMLTRSPAGRSVFDPCVGKEELLGAFAAAGKTIDAIDLVDHGVHALASFRRADFFALLAERQGEPLPHDYLIANPPYNCHESPYVREHKENLRRMFPETGVANLYAMFLSGLIDLAKPGALIGLVTLDSFLTARVYEGLRRKILATCSVHLVALCPTALFRDQHADVRTCLLVLQKGREHQGPVDVLNRTQDTEEFAAALSSRAFAAEPLSALLLDGPADQSEFVIGCPPELRALFEERRLGAVFPCITGISTGNDARYLSAKKSAENPVPFYKNPGSRRFYCEPDAYLPADYLAIAERVSNFMVRNRKLLLREGVVCSSMGVRFGACHRPEQTTFGVNANVVCSGNDLWALLAYLNSGLATFLVRGVLLRSNMITSGYVARIPLPKLEPRVRRRLAALAEEAVKRKIRPQHYDGMRAQIDAELARAFGFSAATQERMRDFQANLVALA